jgi:hypothetical protein
MIRTVKMLVLGFDASTQSVTAVAVDCETLERRFTMSILYSDLKVHGGAGYIHCTDEGRVTQSTAMASDDSTAALRCR